jgi:hypothetical protein
MTRAEVRLDIAQWKRKRAELQLTERIAERERNTTPEEQERMQRAEEDHKRRLEERKREREREREEHKRQEEERKAAIAALRAKPSKDWIGKDYEEWCRLLGYRD